MALQISDHEAKVLASSMGWPGTKLNNGRINGKGDLDISKELVDKGLMRQVENKSPLVLSYQVTPAGLQALIFYAGEKASE